MIGGYESNIFGDDGIKVTLKETQTLAAEVELLLSQFVSATDLQSRVQALQLKQMEMMDDNTTTSNVLLANESDWQDDIMTASDVMDMVDGLEGNVDTLEARSTAA